MKELKDYLHLYLGCECLLEHKVRVTLNGFENNHPVVLNKKDWQSARVNQMDLIKPILRPLSDMTQDEADVIWGILDWNERITGVARITDIIREFDVIEEDNDTTSNAHWGYLCKILPYLLKYGFDLFGLIDAGLAIDKTTLKHPVPDEAPKEWEEQATKDYENGYESETSAIDKFMVADEAGEVYVWVKDEPSKDVNETFVCMIEKRGDGEVTQKPAYAQWLYSQWITEEGWKVIEWLSPAPPSGEDAGKGIGDLKQDLFDFFLWFRENGDLYIDKSIENMISIYIKTIHTNV